MILLLSDRLNTRDMLDKRHCARILCNGEHRVTRFHLFFFISPFSIRCWQHLGIVWNHNLDFFQMVVLARLWFGRKGFLEIFSIASWHIWKLRNGHMCRMKDPLKQIVLIGYKPCNF